MSKNEIKLTQTVQKGGCAAKVAAAELRSILSQVRFPPQDKNVLVDGHLFDDAAIYRVNSEVALVQTLDFFTPIVDSPRIFGAIAAANSLSDVYAMGGRPKTAMGILAFPLATMDKEVIVEVMQGACDLMEKAKVNFVGGHSIDDDSLKFGLSVTGFVHPEKVWTNTGVRKGDVLILTKALGTGTLAAALKKSAISESDMQAALDSMMILNNVMDVLDPELLQQIHAATDITGFGFLGHSLNMAKASEVDFEIQYNQLPVLPGAIASLKQGFLTKAHRTNFEYVSGNLELFSGILDEQRLLLLDPQTSGGLLLSIEASAAPSVLASLQKQFPVSRIVGKALPKIDSEVMLRIR
jgi:selenide,water dikinase